MVEQPSANGYEQTSSPADLANSAVVIGDPAPLFGSAVGKRKRTVSSKPTLTVSLVIPVKNEARNIAWVLEQIADDVSEVILVDGNSTDATLITARSCRPDIRVVSQEGIGKGSALRSGFLAATGDIIVMMDADGSMAPQEIRHYVHFLSNGYDFVKGSRFIAGGGSLDITAFRRLGNRFLLAVFNTLYDARPHRPVLRILRVSPSLFGTSSPFGDRVRDRGRNGRAGNAGRAADRRGSKFRAAATRGQIEPPFNSGWL